MKRALLTLAVLSAMVGSGPVKAADAVTDALQTAYAPYRLALYRTNGKSIPESQQAMAQAKAAWQGISSQFGAKPPAPYDRDAEFSMTLAKVAKVYDKASQEIDQGKLKEAHTTLEDARELMAEMRSRNQVITYSDHMNAYHEVMEHLLDEGGKWLAEPKGTLKILAQVGALEMLSKRLRTQAPAALRSDAEFNAGLQALEASVAALREAAMAQDASALKEAMPKLKQPYSKLFLKFG